MDYITLNIDQMDVKAGSPTGKIQVDLWGVDHSEILTEVPDEMVLEEARQLHSWTEYLAGIDLDDILGALDKHEILTWVAENCSQEDIKDLVVEEDEDEDEEEKPQGPVH